MNLMFRKNFSGEKTLSSSGGGGKARGALGAGRNAKRRDRERYSCMEEHHYKTHIFFSAAPRASAQYNDLTERCGPVLGGGTGPEPEPPQPLVTREPSVSLLRWDRGPATTTTVPTTTDRRRTEPVSLATLQKDCFVIPAHALDRFLPDGVPLPVPPPTPEKGMTTKTAQNSLSILEIADPKLCILAHLMSPLEPIEPILESPLAKPLIRQKAAAGELLNEVAQANTAVGGMLLANMEKNAEFPFISYYVINTTQTDPLLFYNNMRCSSLNKFDPKTIRYSAAHTLDLYSEVAMICRPPFNDLAGGPKKSHTPTTGFIISVYKVFEGDDGERFERNWLYWTGARMLYRHLPHTVGMRKIALHKSVAAHGDKMYLLVCECANLMDDLSGAAMLVTALRARLCGYTGLYRPIQTF
ncbi:uncharacterized protein LOC110376076 isoform X1 [Helicoverpa armigera]|uniref:DUF7153 domain-containing protein n=2 Tax=Heliothinae TaxID=95178 RepID=A0A2A4J4M7_HELVI|nr:uncharacterized protein LOC110376076 isoform X1 [Helicoverpa armigera]XP_047025372.1 uncharacterized protein LOC124634019 isoform X1 [Helicoverpa zea]XP_047025373.1 uncharacterized protein LOC124634019 isoform X1 [Helicoverpa zea]XP_049703571.1 uncharacterized protein LOC110376076 isoform X1 [Helicoverpa armigera]XP_049703572.1 uncharacterized protein LOC110376076 isoform X1 [Helicoverpa armigera]XP_049703573.1 uncharacterized protein LOC110376076 isoform X1 [Helicoverpa armigera]PZC78192.